MKLAVVVQARLGSTRLPRKVLMPLAGKPLLSRMIERVQAAETAFDLVVATTTSPEDDPIRELCSQTGIHCYSGHPTDLLDRHYKAVLEQNVDAVVKIPSDCPLVDPAVIDKVLGFYVKREHQLDFASNLHPATYPDGNDVEVMSMTALETAWREANKTYEREHTTPFFWEQPERFRIGNVEWDTGLDYSMSHRWTIDYAEDYQFIKEIYDALWSTARPVFSLEDILNLLNSRPDIVKINSKYAGVNWYRHHLNELKTVTIEQTKTA